MQSLNLKAFQKSNNDKNPHAMLNKQYGRYYSIKFDSTQKFFQELNGSMIQTVFSCNTIINFPCSLTTIEGESLIMKIVTFFCSMIDRQKCWALFSGGTIFRDTHFRKSLTCHEQALYLHRTWVQALLN